MPLLRFFSSGILRAALVWLGLTLLVLYFAAGALILAGRWWLMPEVKTQKPLVEQKLSAAIGLPVKIGALDASWPGLYPHLTIDGLQIHDHAGQPALSFERVEAEIGWSSLWHFGLRLHRLDIDAPALDIHRDAAGRFFVAGLPVQGGEDSGFADWLLAQGRIVVRDASLTWRDALRAAPPLVLSGVNFDLRNFGRHHSFGLAAAPPASAAERLDLRGNLVGGSFTDLRDWHGELYAELAQANLGVWLPWVTLPLDMERGRGGMRLWLEFEALRPTGVTAELQLADARLRLRPDLPVLALERLDGRVSARWTDKELRGEIRRLSLATADGIVLPPTDAHIEATLSGWRAGGRFSANQIDFTALTALAGHLPLPEQVHRRLAATLPQGQLSDLALRWEGAIDAPQHWQARTRFENLALAAQQGFPGFSGISGRLDGDDAAGKVSLDSRAVRIELPAVFADPVLMLTRLEAEAGWRRRVDGLDLHLAKASFRNDDASGDASGTYRYSGQGPGEIDLSAKLVNASGNAVWRYMPLVVNRETRDWLRTGIGGGVSDSTTLRLKGPLERFPFRGGQGGIFQVKGLIRGASLDVAPGWPRINGIDGELLFEGERMLISAHRGDIMGAALSNVRAEIADLEAPEELLVVTGHARGETQNFLDFIEASPVGARIDHFTAPMSARGQGELTLRLDMPLRRIADTKVHGGYKFADNQMRVLPGLPPLTAAQGEFEFTSDSLRTKALRARLFDTPVALEVASAAGGAVRVDASGRLVAQGLRQEYALRAFERLSGDAVWRGSVTVKRPTAEVRIESTLDGLASTLPEPFAKTARASWPLKVSGRIEGDREEWTATLGKTASVRLQNAGGRWRGHAALGETAQKSSPPLPDRGVILAVAQPVLDFDAWRTLLAAADVGANTMAVSTAEGTLALTALDLRSGVVRLLRRDFHDVRLDGAKAGERWRFNLDSREARGQLSWDGSGAGRIGGRFASLTWPAAESSLSAGGEPADTDDAKDYPAIDLIVDSFRLHDMAFGEVRVNAENQNGAWQARLDMKNEHARLAGTGRWRPGPGKPETALNFKLEVGDAEKLLARLGLPDALRRGDGRIEGNLAWAGAPFSFDLSSLSGHLKADIGKGQFKKLEPGVGRLLGVLSLQSLPRRITLDFRDIFSEGFAFDSIEGTADIERGRMRTDELKIRGPAAKILLSGRADLIAETQDLKVRVQPALGESIAVGAMLANPVAGAVAWAAQKLLNDPLDQAFAYEYAVTGGWSDPKVEKLTHKTPETKAAVP